MINLHKNCFELRLTFTNTIHSFYNRVNKKKKENGAQAGNFKNIINTKKKGKRWNSVEELNLSTPSHFFNVNGLEDHGGDTELF